MPHELKVLGPEVNRDAVRDVENLLERLRSGETIGVALVEARRNRAVATLYSPGGSSYHLLNSGAARLANQIASMTDD